jgi:hypothetical protein
LYYYLLVFFFYLSALVYTDRISVKIIIDDEWFWFEDKSTHVCVFLLFLLFSVKVLKVRSSILRKKVYKQLFFFAILWFNYLYRTFFCKLFLCLCVCECFKCKYIWKCNWNFFSVNLLILIIIIHLKNRQNIVFL